VTKNNILKFRTLSKKEAEKEISSFILKNKKSGLKKISTLDVVLNLKLPAQQVEKVFEGFIKEKKIKEIDA